ncbi:hypothetical protein NIES4103_22840 [Nostoc sp. NIES-4103]|nr:hypothetical protein NIES4103_22840 [Nostoc sp. NIES-4103]
MKVRLKFFADFLRNTSNPVPNVAKPKITDGSGTEAIVAFQLFILKFSDSLLPPINKNISLIPALPTLATFNELKSRKPSPLPNVKLVPKISTWFPDSEAIAGRDVLELKSLALLLSHSR